MSLFKKIGFIMNWVKFVFLCACVCVCTSHVVKHSDCVFVHIQLERV